jgi:hypothetical protein
LLAQIPEQAGYSYLLSAERPRSAARVGDAVARALIGDARSRASGAPMAVMTAFGQVVRVIDEMPDRVDQADYVMSAERR